MEYTFEITAGNLRNLSRDAALHQTSYALEQQTELRSRERLPGLWRITDKLRTLPHATDVVLKKRRKRTKILSLICLVLGVFALVPGMTEPCDPILILAGVVGICFGLFRFLGTQKPKNLFIKPARQMIDKLFSFTDDRAMRITFMGTEMILEDIHTGIPENRRAIPYPGFECAIECNDLYLLAYAGNGIVLPKCCQTNGTPEQFRAFLSPKICYLLL